MKNEMSKKENILYGMGIMVVIISCPQILLLDTI